MRTLLFFLFSSFLLACQAEEPQQLNGEKAISKQLDALLMPEIFDLARKNNGGKEPTREELLQALRKKMKEEVSKPLTKEAAQRHKEIEDLARKNNGGKEPTKQDLWKAFVQKTRQAAGSTHDYGNYRLVPKGAKPEIIVNNNTIQINGQQLEFGGNIEDWKKAIGGKSECKIISANTNPLINCDWHDFGLSISTAKNSLTSVKGLYLQIIKQPLNQYFTPATVSSNGTPIKPRPDFRLKNEFTGYLEIDGYGIDAKTQYWEIESNINPERELGCGLSACTHARANGLSMELSRGGEKGNIKDLYIRKAHFDK